MKQFYFIFEREEELFDPEEALYFYIVDQEFFDTNKYIDDSHIDDQVYATIPEDKREHFENTIFECMESVFEAEMTEEELIEYLSQFPNFKQAELDRSAW